MTSLSVFVITRAYQMNLHYVREISLQTITTLNGDLSHTMSVLMRCRAMRGVQMDSLTTAAFASLYPTEVWDSSWSRRLLDEVTYNNSLLPVPAEFIHVVHLEPDEKTGGLNYWVLKELEEHLHFRAARKVN